MTECLQRTPTRIKKGDIIKMPITELLEKNAQMYGDEVSLVEINPKAMEHAKVTWREYSLIETNPMEAGRTEITWKEFDKKVKTDLRICF